MEVEVRGDMMAMLNNLFDVVVTRCLNSPIKIKAKSYDVLDFIVVDDLNFSKLSSTQSSNGYAYEFSSNLFYKENIQFLESECKFVFSLYKEYLIEKNINKNGYECVSELMLPTESIIKSSLAPAAYKNINFNFKASWAFDCVVCSVFSLQNILVSSINQAKQTIPVKGDYKNFRVFDSNITSKSLEWIESEDDSSTLIMQEKCDFDMNLQFSYKVHRSELFKVCVKGSDCDEYKNLEFNIKLPCGPKIYDWDTGRMYFKSDLVVYDKEIYKCIEDHISEVAFKKECWEKIENNDESNVSFSSYNSFFNSTYGKLALKKINEDISIAYEKNAGDLLTIECVLYQEPKLNQFFLYMNKKFRVIKISFIGLNKFSIVGREILKKINFDSESISFASDKNISTCEIDFISERRGDKVFEGLFIKTPENTEVADKLEVVC